MADVLPSQLVTSVMAKLYDVLTNGDDTVPKSEDHFFSWATPGIPVEAADFEFLSQGLTGVINAPAVSELVGASVGAGGGSAAPVELSPALLEQLRAADTAKLYMQAENFARLVDFVPDVTTGTNNQFASLNVLNNEGSLSDAYEYVMRMSQVMQTELPEETKKQIEVLREHLTIRTTKKSMIPGHPDTQLVEPSLMVNAYNEKLADYEKAALAYNTARVDAVTASNSRAVHYWAMNAPILRNQVKAAMQAWVKDGYKNDYEEISAFIDQVMRRDMALLKQDYRDDLDKARLTGLASGSNFLYTQLVPANFAESSGWTQFRFSSADMDTNASTVSSTKKWKTQAAGGYLGIFGARGGHGVDTTRTEYKKSFDSSQFNLSFEICQAQIVRPWLKLAFLLSPSWRFDQGDAVAKDKIVSDGALPPRGSIPAIPTSVIFIRNLRLSLGHASGLSEFLAESTSSTTSGGGYAAFGPWHVGGTYSRATTNGSTQHHAKSHWDGQEMIVEGMQISGFKCHILPKTPKPMPGITKWV